MIQIIFGFLNQISDEICRPCGGRGLCQCVGDTDFYGAIACYTLIALGLGIIYALPYISKLGKIVPSPLVTIVALTVISVMMGLDVRIVGDMDELPDTLPVFYVVMITMVAIVLYPPQLSPWRGAGVLLAFLFFANKIGCFMSVQSSPTPDKIMLAYGVMGQVFFASTDRFVAQFDFDKPIKAVSIDLTYAHF